jgi:hypothetical protein
MKRPAAIQTPVRGHPGTLAEHSRNVSLGAVKRGNPKAAREKSNRLATTRTTRKKVLRQEGCFQTFVNRRQRYAEFRIRQRTKTVGSRPSLLVSKGMETTGMGLSPSRRSTFCLARIDAILDAIPPGRSEPEIRSKGQGNRPFPSDFGTRVSDLLRTSALGLRILTHRGFTARRVGRPCG